jgi:hypothetical protein
MGRKQSAFEGTGVSSGKAPHRGRLCPSVYHPCPAQVPSGLLPFSQAEVEAGKGRWPLQSWHIGNANSASLLQYPLLPLPPC